jgi:hypothetical protein
MCNNCDVGGEKEIKFLRSRLKKMEKAASTSPNQKKPSVYKVGVGFQPNLRLPAYKALNRNVPASAVGPLFQVTITCNANNRLLARTFLIHLLKSPASPL